MQLACSTASFPLEPLPRALARVSWAGYRAVELALPGGDPEPAEGASELRDRLQANELQVTAVHAGELSAAAGEAALAAGVRIGRAALLARQLGGERVIVTAPTAGGIEALATGLDQLLAALGGEPVRIAVTNRAQSLLPGPEAMVDLRRRVASSRLELALDPAEAVLAGWDAASALGALPDVPAYIYLTDARAGQPVPPGEGDVDWPRLAAALRRAGCDGVVTLRLAGADPWAVEPTAKEVRFAALQWFGLDPWAA
jgi:sugar phosphate isomerase/epimerase